MLVADRQHAGGDGGRERLAVARRRKARRRARRRSGTVIGATDQDRVDQPAFAVGRQPRVMQQKNHVREGRVLHQLERVVSAHAQMRRPRVDNRRLPRLHRGRIIACWHACHRVVTVTAP